MRSPKIEGLAGEGFHYITAITKPQIEVLLRQGVLQMGLFDAMLTEVTTAEGPRYVLRRNPLRAEEIAAGRRLSLVEDQEALAEASKLDGCYCLKTDLAAAQASKEIVHDRYEDLANAELLSTVQVRLPGVLPHRNTHVTTKRKLPSRRKTR